MVIRDLVHLRNSLQAGNIDVGVIVAPSDTLQKYLPDRTLNFSTAKKYIEEEFKEAQDMPLILFAIEHDGPGATLPKQKRRS